MGQQHRNIYREQIKEVKSTMRWPHKLDIVCTGRGGPQTGRVGADVDG